MKFNKLNEGNILFLYTNPIKTEFQIFFINNLSNNSVKFTLFQRDYENMEIFFINRELSKEDWNDRKRTWELTQQIDFYSKEDMTNIFDFVFRVFK